MTASASLQPRAPAARLLPQPDRGALESAVYTGWVRHRRFGTPAHTFRAPIRLLYLDLSELETVLGLHPLFGFERARPVSFRRADYLGPQELSLDEAVRQRVGKALRRRPEGPIRLLTQLRCWGYAFNPVSFYYCFDPSGTHLEAVVAEITNTPWGERHAYVLSPEAAVAPGRWVFAKAFHVSPFFPMQHHYDWRITPPGERIVVHMENWRDPETAQQAKAFDATLILHRAPITRAALGRALWRQPLGALGFHASIYWQALRLWLKGVKFHDHPKWRGGAPLETP